MSSKERITEKRNIFTEKIDLLSACGILSMLEKVDGELFSGFETYKSVYDNDIIDSLCQLASQMKIETKNGGKIVFGGCGTSGRLGWLCSRNYNICLGKEIFDYTMAGNDKALIVSREAFEDDPKLGGVEVDESKASLYVGISCGLSAPYVAGQLQFCVDNKIKCGVMGFNPMELARTTKLNDQGSFYDVVKTMSGLSKMDNFVINPVIGPEGITGSTRMKGGSMTKILLDAAFALSQMDLIEREVAWQLINMYEATCRFTYIQNREELGKLCEVGGKSLLEGGSIYYVGAGESGIWGIIDSSECVPTYGSKHEDIRGFILGGWNSMRNKEVKEMSECKEPYFQISTDYFAKEILPKLSEKDVVIFVSMESSQPFVSESDLFEIENEVFSKVLKTEAKPFVIHVSSFLEKKSYAREWGKEVPAGHFLHYKLPRICIDKNLPSFGAFSIKLILNAISTISHVLKGVTVSNIMVNLKLSNTKLLVRGTRIVSQMCNVEESVARKAVLKAIYGNEDYNDENNDIGHIRKAAKLDKIVPKAMLFVNRSCESVEEAEKVLSKEPILRNVIKNLLK